MRTASSRSATASGSSKSAAAVELGRLGGLSTARKGRKYFVALQAKRKYKSGGKPAAGNSSQSSANPPRISFASVPDSHTPALALRPAPASYSSEAHHLRCTCAKCMRAQA